MTSKRLHRFVIVVVSGLITIVAMTADNDVVVVPRDIESLQLPSAVADVVRSDLWSSDGQYVLWIELEVGDLGETVPDFFDQHLQALGFTACSIPYRPARELLRSHPAGGCWKQDVYVWYDDHRSLLARVIRSVYPTDGSVPCPDQLEAPPGPNLIEVRFFRLGSPLAISENYKCL